MHIHLRMSNLLNSHTGSDCVYSLELLRIIAHEDHENPSKETSGFIYRSLLASLKKYLQKGELQNEATVVALVQALLDHLQHAVSANAKPIFLPGSHMYIL